MRAPHHNKPYHGYAQDDMLNQGIPFFFSYVFSPSALFLCCWTPSFKLRSMLLSERIRSFRLDSSWPFRIPEQGVFPHQVSLGRLSSLHMDAFRCQDTAHLPQYTYLVTSKL